MTLTYTTSHMHQIVIPTPRTLFLLDPGHGGDSSAVKKLKLSNYNIGTGTDASCPNIKNLPQLWGYDPPPADQTWTNHYVARTGAGYLHERHVVLDVARHAWQRISELISEARLNTVMEASLTRSDDSPVTIAARKSKYNNALLPQLADAQSVITLAHLQKQPRQEPRRFQYVVFLSLHAEGHCSRGEPGAFFLTGKGHRKNQPLLEHYIAELRNGIDHVASRHRGRPLQLSSRAAMERTDVGVVLPPYVNTFSVLIEVDNFTSWTGYQNMQDQEWRKAMGEACALGMFRFSRILYGSHEYIENTVLCEAAETVARRIDTVLTDLGPGTLSGVGGHAIQ